MKKLFAAALAVLCALLAACSCVPETAPKGASGSAVLENIPEYNGYPYVELDGNKPDFSEKDRQKTKSFEKYSRLDSLGRCGAAYANVSTDTMPTAPRESISAVEPSGWNQKYYSFIKDGYIYNRCHLIGFQLTGENANERNLITGTRYMNVEGMLPFENQVAEYVTSTKHHVLYRVTPIFEGDNLVANGVEMEAWSVEDNGKGVCFDVYCYNVQPGVVITYANGSSKIDKSKKITAKSSVSGSVSKTEKVKTYIINKNSGKFHYPDCDAVRQTKKKNKEKFTGKRSELIKKGYSPCGQCNP